MIFKKDFTLVKGLFTKFQLWGKITRSLGISNPSCSSLRSLGALQMGTNGDSVRELSQRKDFQGR